MATLMLARWKWTTARLPETLSIQYIQVVLKISHEKWTSRRMAAEGPNSVFLHSIASHPRSTQLLLDLQVLGLCAIETIFFLCTPHYQVLPLQELGDDLKVSLRLLELGKVRAVSELHPFDLRNLLEHWPHVHILCLTFGCVEKERRHVDVVQLVYARPRLQRSCATNFRCTDPTHPSQSERNAKILLPTLCCRPSSPHPLH